MGYYEDNRGKLLKKAHDKYHNGGGKEKAALYYQKNKEIIKKRERDRYKLMTVEERKNKIEKSLDRYYILKELSIKNEQVKFW